MPGKYTSTVANALHDIAISKSVGLEPHDIRNAIHSAIGDDAALKEIGQEIMSRITSQHELRAAQQTIPELQLIPSLRDPEIWEQQVQRTYIEKYGENPNMTPPNPHRRRNEIDKQIDGLKQRMADGIERDWDAINRKVRQLDTKRKEAIAEDQAEVDEFKARVQEMNDYAANAGIGPVHASRARHREGVQKLVDAGVVTDGNLITDDAILADPTDLVGAAARLKRHEEQNLDPVSKEMKGAKGKDDLRRILRNTPGIVVEGGGSHHGEAQ